MHPRADADTYTYTNTHTYLFVVHQARVEQGVCYLKVGVHPVQVDGL